MYKLKYAIPDMTNTTSPSGQVIFSSQYSSYYAWKVFDYENSTYWFPTAVPPQFIGYKFPNAKTIIAYSFICRNANGGYPKTWTFQGSNDNTNWTTLDTQNDWVLIGNLNTPQFFEINDNDTNYLYYRLYITAVGGTETKPVLHTLKLYEKDPDFIESIPCMTSNTTPSGIASASSVASTGYEAYRAFDKIDEGTQYSRWAPSNNTVTTPAWLQYQFPTPKKIVKYAIQPHYSSAFGPRDWIFQGSTNGSTWVDLDIRTGYTSWITTPRQLIFFDVDNSTEYLYYRIYITYRNSNSISFEEFAMYETALIEPITVGTLTYTTITDDSVGLSLPFTGDENENSSVMVNYKTDTDSEYVEFGEMVRDDEVFLLTVDNLNPGTRYDFQAVVIDDNGITGDSIQYVLDVDTTYNRVRIENLIIDETYNSKTITADIIGDDDTNSIWQYRYRRSAVGNFTAGAWSEYIPITVSEGQINFTITGMIKSTGYDIEIDITDAGGVDNGTTY